MKQFLIIIFSFAIGFLYSQDTLQLMQYNLLNYGNYTDYCTSGNNNVNVKNGYLRTIVNYVKPDILTVNELTENETYHDMLLNEVLNTDGVSYYKRTISTNAADSYLVNMLYYNSEKLTIYSQNIVHSMVRDINVYTLYFNSEDLAETHDTLFLTCFVAHLKAGSQSWDANKRAQMVSSAMTYIRTHDLHDNMLFMGDLNVYSDQEQAYKNLIYTYNGIRYFYDPIDTEGAWNNNYSFRNVHTQSTHTGGGCAAGGGLDDRFDFIMSTESLLEGQKGMKLLNNTYAALGNDGQHFNKSIKDAPTNVSAPESVINALYGASDHLPILVKIAVDASFDELKELSNISSVHFQNPSPVSLKLKVRLKEPQKLIVEIYNIYGHRIFLSMMTDTHKKIEECISLATSDDGVYVLRLTDEAGKTISRKFILKK